MGSAPIWRVAINASLFLTISASICLAQSPSGRCLSYEPVVVTLGGKLIRKTFPGPPNYENIQKGDKPETYWLLNLDQPICVDQSQENPDLNPARRDVRVVQLVVNADVYKTPARFLGKRVLVTGTLFGEHTAHHHTAVLLTVSSISGRDADSP